MEETEPENSLKNRLLFYFNLMFMVIFMEILPTYDIFSDIDMGITWVNSRPLWSLCVLSILIIHTTFQFCLWYRLEPKHRKKYSWIFVILQIFPQYRAAIIIYHTIRKCMIL